MMVKNDPEFFILKFTEPFQICCFPVQKKINPERHNLAWQVSSSVENHTKTNTYHKRHPSTLLKLKDFKKVQDIGIPVGMLVGIPTDFG